MFCFVFFDSQPASRGPTAPPVPSAVTARLGCPVTMKQEGAVARPDSQELAVRNVRTSVSAQIESF